MTLSHRSINQVPGLPRPKRMEVTREEFNGIVDLLNERSETINLLQSGLDIQFKRIAQMQAELDQIKRALDKWTTMANHKADEPSVRDPAQRLG